MNGTGKMRSESSELQSRGIVSFVIISTISVIWKGTGLLKAEQLTYKVFRKMLTKYWLKKKKLMNQKYSFIRMVHQFQLTEALSLRIKVLTLRLWIIVISTNLAFDNKTLRKCLPPRALPEALMNFDGPLFHLWEEVTQFTLHINFLALNWD